MFSVEYRSDGEVWVNLKELLDWTTSIMKEGISQGLPEEETLSQQGFITGLRKEFFPDEV